MRLSFSFVIFSDVSISEARVTVLTVMRGIDDRLQCLIGDIAGNIAVFIRIAERNIKMCQCRKIDFRIVLI